MNDNEIIKALECCGREKDNNCDNCPLTELQLSECTAKVATDALNLINRQKVEIERLNETLDIYAVEFDSKFESVKSEAIKEFEEEIEKRCVAGGIYPAFVKATINRVKEKMTEDNE